MSPRRVGVASGAIAAVLVAAAVGVVVAPLVIVGAAVVGLLAGVAAYRTATAARGRDGAERLLVLATAGLPTRRAEWGAAMRAELAALEDAEARRRFAWSASAAAFGRGLGLRVAVAGGTGLAVAAATLITSRVQLPDRGPGVLAVTVPLPAILLLAVALATAWMERSFRAGFRTGVLALAASFAAVFAVVAAEGLAWMDRHGIFVLDGEPPRHPASDLDVVLDFFTTGMWLGHLVFWLLFVAAGAALGARLPHAAWRPRPG